MRVRESLRERARDLERERERLHSTIINIRQVQKYEITQDRIQFRIFKWETETRVGIQTKRCWIIFVALKRGNIFV